MVRDAINKPRLLPLAALGLMLGLASGRASGDTGQPDNFANLSFEELGDIQITSVSKKAERLADAAASVFVIRADDIRRAGASTLPEALRLAPNLEVARIDARNYAITARGFNGAFENKLLVLIDGRTVYTPLFSGVYWDAQDVMIEDIERIEVISGPGATLWGANAVNGVINIITRSAADTQGALVGAGASRQQTDGGARYGGALPGGGYLRGYAKHVEDEDTHTSTGQATFTGWRRDQAGFRADLPALGGAATVQGDAYQGKLRQFGTADIDIGGANLLARLNRTLDKDSAFSVQAYIDRTERDQPNAFREHLTTLDIEAQHTVQLGAHALVWGGGYRKAYDRVDNGASFSFLPGDLNLFWSNLFAQDELHLTQALRLTGGLKIENNSYTGREWLPSLSLAWQAAPDQLFWSSLARAVRVPSRIDHDIYVPSKPVVVNGVPHYSIGGGPDLASEVAKVAQLGYRGQPAPALSYAVTLYASDYDRLRTLEPNPSGIGAIFRNGAEGSSRGIEMSGQWEVRRGWRLSAGLTAQRLLTRDKPGVLDLSNATALANNDPSSWSSLRSSFDLSESTKFDMLLRHVGALPNPYIPSYNALDLHLGWRPVRSLEVSLLAQNLIAGDHVEFGPVAGRSIIGRMYTVRLTWHY